MSRVLEFCEGSTRIARELCRVLLAVSFGFQHVGIEGSGFTRYQVCRSSDATDALFQSDMLCLSILMYVTLNPKP